MYDGNNHGGISGDRQVDDERTGNSCARTWRPIHSRVPAFNSTGLGAIYEGDEISESFGQNSVEGFGDHEQIGKVGEDGVPEN